MAKPQVTLLDTIESWREETQTLHDSIDDLGLLDTVDKSSVVDSINEVNDGFIVLENIARTTRNSANELAVVVQNSKTTTNELQSKILFDLDDIEDHGNAGLSLTIDASIHDVHMFNCDQSTLSLTINNFENGRFIKLIITNGDACTITYPDITKLSGDITPILNDKETVVFVQKVTAASLHLFRHSFSVPTLPTSSLLFRVIYPTLVDTINLAPADLWAPLTAEYRSIFLIDSSTLLPIGDILTNIKNSTLLNSGNGILLGSENEGYALYEPGTPTNVLYSASVYFATIYKVAKVNSSLLTINGYPLTIGA